MNAHKLVVGVHSIKLPISCPHHRMSWSRYCTQSPVTPSALSLFIAHVAYIQIPETALQVQHDR